MAYGAVILAFLIGLTGTPFAPDARYLAPLVYLSIVGSAVAFTVYLLLVTRIGSAQAGYTTVLFPVVAISLSTLFEGYRWDMMAGTGLALAVLGNLIIFWQRPAPRAER